MKQVHIIGGGTFSHVRNHLALCAPAFGQTAKQLKELIEQEVKASNLDWQVHLHLTKMADSSSSLVTNEDVDALVKSWVSDPETKMIIFNAALCDFNGSIQGMASGAHAKRLKTVEGSQQMDLVPALKVISQIRKTRKDIFVVGFKTTTEERFEDQYTIAMQMLKKNSLNLVYANDTLTRRCAVLVPEEAHYGLDLPRSESLALLAKMSVSRAQNTFTRSTVVEGDLVPWSDEKIAPSLRKVVDHCIERGAYKPLMGKTVGHFACKVSDQEILTSPRKSNFNELKNTGLVKITPEGNDKVIAVGAKPSVGGQSQRIIFNEHKDLDCIVHFHCPPKPNVKVPVASQWQNECGSHECGKNTSTHLAPIDAFAGQLKVVYLDNHGPNIVFNKNVDPVKVIEFIETHFDLEKKTGGSFSPQINESKSVKLKTVRASQ